MINFRKLYFILVITLALFPFVRINAETIDITDPIDEIFSRPHDLSPIIYYPNLINPNEIDPGIIDSKDFCRNWNSNMKLGDSGNDLIALKRAMIKEGISKDTYVFSNEFDQKLFVDISTFQERYANDILYPNGLTKGNGFVGISTRAKLNKLYSCSKVIPISTPVLPIITSPIKILIPPPVISIPTPSPIPITSPKPSLNPTITSISPSSSQPGTSITIYGSNFNPRENQVYLGSSVGTYVLTSSNASGISNNGTTLTFTVPTWARGPYNVWIENASLLSSNKVSFNAIEPLPSQSPSPSPSPTPNVSGTPDLTVSSLSLNSYTLAPGGSLTLSGKIKNIGNSIAQGTFVNNIAYRQGNSSWTSWQNTEGMSNLAPGEERPFSYTWTVGQVDNNDYYFKVLADPSNTISESNEGNNDPLITNKFRIVSSLQTSSLWDALVKYFSW